MPPKKKPSIEDEFNSYKEEIERKSQTYLNRIIQLIDENRRTSEQKIEEIEKKYQQRIQDLEEKINNQIPVFNRTSNEYVQQKTDVFHNTEISRPVFYGNNRDQHPRDFLNRLEEYFAIKQTYIGEKLIIIGDCLKATAHNWFSTIRFQLSNYDDFKRIFMEEYWSREIQIQVWSQCLNIKQIPPSTNYREHFSAWATKLRHLEVPRLSESEIVKNIAKHYPGYIRAILISLPDRNILAAMKILGEEEHGKQSEGNHGSHDNQKNQSQSNWEQRGNNTQQSNQRPRNHWNPKGQPKENNYNNRTNSQSYEGSSKQQINQVSIEINEEEEGPRGEGSSNQITHAVNSMPTNHKTVSPYLQCKLEGVSVQLLIDTGATISVLTKEVVDRILHNNSKVPMLPINGVQISNAVGKKICKISKQIFCECKIGSAVIFANFVQVENLNEKGIIGADILQQYNTQINFSDRTITWEVNEIEHTTTFAKTEPAETTKDQQMFRLQASDNEADGQQNQEFLQLMNKYKNIFSTNPGKIKNYQCQIKVKEGEPIYQRPYPIPMAKMARMNEEIQRMLDLGIIEQSTSPWSSPIVGIEKKNGDVRVCIDARKINQRIIPDRECPMNIDEILIKFEGAQYMSSIDLTAGYWQCTLKPECREVTAFLYRGRNYQYKVLPFGLVNSVAEFQKILDKVLGPEILEFAAVYVDDIHIMSKSFSEHMDHLEQIFKKFSDYNVTINPAKSQFFRLQVLFLGHIISKEGIRMDPDKIRTIQNFQPPKNRKQIQAFLGFINFYRKHIRDLSKLTTILSNLLKKGITWDWTEQHQEAFEKIKQLFLEDLVIQYPDFNEDFYLSTDASSTAIGAELFQVDKDGKHRTIGFMSRTLKEAERNYYTTELELLAIVCGCKKFRNYIVGHPTKVLTDHKALIFLNQCQLLNPRLTRWAITLQEFNLEILHIPGKENIGADMLTRYPQSEKDEGGRNVTNITINKLLLHEYSRTLTNQFKHMGELQRQDTKLNRIINRIQSVPIKHFIISKQLLFSIHHEAEYRLMIPEIMKVQLIQETHWYLGHVGTYKVYQALKPRYQMSNMYNSIKKITKSCELCQKSKVNNQLTRGPTISILPDTPQHTVSLDLMGPLPKGPLGVKYILALIDIFSKHVRLYAIRKATTDIILKKVLIDYVPKHGPIKQILTDNGTQFRSTKWTKQLQGVGIKAVFTTTYHPESNPVERANREIGRMLRTYCHRRHSSWAKWLETVEYWLNNTTHHSTGFTPNEIITGKKLQLPIDQLLELPGVGKDGETKVIVQLVQRKIKKSATTRNQCKDKGKKFPAYEKGQQILVKEHRPSSANDKEIHKFFLLYRGPYTIIHVMENNTVTIQDENEKVITYNMKNVKLYIPPDPGKAEGPAE